MSIAGRIRQTIATTPLGKIFSTRQFLSLGTRGAVDQALYCLVKEGRIIRLARGLFTKTGSRPATILAVARAKARAFGRRLVRHGADTAAALSFPTEKNQTPTFAISGRSSSFRFGTLTIRFVGTSPRKLVGGSRLLGRVIRAMWHVGRSCLTNEMMARTYPLWAPALGELERAAPNLPDWVNRKFYWAKPAVRVRGQVSNTSPLIPDLEQLLPEFADLFARIAKTH